MYTAILCLDACGRARTVTHVVYLSVTGDLVSEDGFKQTMRTRGYPHLLSKVLVEQRLLYGDFHFAWTVLGPPFFFTNDETMKQPLLTQSVFPLPVYKSAVTNSTPRA